MTDQRAMSRRGTKRMASTSVADLKLNIHRERSKSTDLADDYEFLVPGELSTLAVGLLHSLTTKRITTLSFTTLYWQSRKVGWLAVLNRERKSLKSNINSIEKCFIINRLIHACGTDSKSFTQLTQTLYKGLLQHMSETENKIETVDNWCSQVRNWQTSLNYRRFFHINPRETNQCLTVFDFQRESNQLLKTFFTDSTPSVPPGSPSSIDQSRYLKEFLQNAFVITLQPSTPECVGATKYDKVGQDYVSKLNCRLLCLLNADEVSKYLTLSPISVTLYLLEQELDEQGEKQASLHWQQRTVTDGQGRSHTFLYADLQSIQLKKFDLRSTRPLYSSKLCHLQFTFQIKIPLMSIEETFTLVTRPFGLCSHAQYFPEYLAQLFLHEFRSLIRTVDEKLVLSLMNDFICRYHVRITGVPMQLHTQQFIIGVLQKIEVCRQASLDDNSLDIFQGILGKLFSQMEFFVDHPFLSMMYLDGLFYGITDRNIDHALRGRRSQPEVLLRFNTLIDHQTTQQASVRYIVHNGELTRASFHMKAFVNDMCRMIYESNDDTILIPRIHSTVPELDFRAFQHYYDSELIRISGIEPPIKEAYKPLMAILWSTLRTTTPNGSDTIMESQDSTSSTGSEHKSIQVDLPSSDTDPMIETKQRRVISSDEFIGQIIEQLSTVSIEYHDETTPPKDLSIAQRPMIVFGSEQKEQLSLVLRSYFQSRVQSSRSSSSEERKCSADLCEV